jgi:uncharacterized membrane protein SirB2
MDYTVVKAVHVSCVVISYLLFFTRGVWMINDSPLLRQRWVRILPHVNDTLLLAAAIALALMLKQYPLTDGWLTAKVTGLVAYILIGTVAMKPGRTRRVRIAAWIVAQVVFFYIVGVALTRNPLPFL